MEIFRVKLSVTSAIAEVKAEFVEGNYKYQEAPAAPHNSVLPSTIYLETGRRNLSNQKHIIGQVSKSGLGRTYKSAD